MVETARRLVVIDTTGEWDVGGHANGVEESLRRIRALSDARAPRFRLACRVTSLDADYVLRAVWALQPDPITPDRRHMIALVVEESDLVSKPGDRDTGIDYLIQFGRRVADPLILNTRRLARISRDATANARELVLFRCVEPNDLIDLKRRRGPELEAQVRALEGHNYVIA